MSDESAVFASGTCRVCTNGELVFSILAAEKRLIIECLECLTGYAAPADLTTSRVVRMDQMEARLATLNEVEAAGMGDLLAR